MQSTKWLFHFLKILSSLKSIISNNFFLYIFDKWDVAPWQVITHDDIDIKYSKLKISRLSARYTYLFLTLNLYKELSVFSEIDFIYLTNLLSFMPVVIIKFLSVQTEIFFIKLNN